MSEKEETIWEAFDRVLSEHEPLPPMKPTYEELEQKLAAATEKNTRLMEASAELVREKDAEIAEIRESWSASKVNELIKKSSLLEVELASVKAERDALVESHAKLSQDFAALVIEHDALRARIEGAPKVWCLLLDGKVQSASRCEYEDANINPSHHHYIEHDQYIQAHAVPVEDAVRDSRSAKGEKEG